VHVGKEHRGFVAAVEPLSCNSRSRGGTSAPGSPSSLPCTSWGWQGAGGAGFALHAPVLCRAGTGIPGSGPIPPPLPTTHAQTRQSESRVPRSQVSEDVGVTETASSGSQRARLNNVFAGVLSAEKPVSNKNTWEEARGDECLIGWGHPLGYPHLCHLGRPSVSGEEERSLGLEDLKGLFQPKWF